MPTQEVHVGDIGTLYRVKIQDAGAPFDPSDAETTTIIFSFPSGTVEVEADVLHDGDDWYLTYQVTEDDAAYHATKGRFTMQGHLVFANGDEFHTKKGTIDDDGNELRIWPNIAVGSPS